jgi:4-amino-4-deoxy-L-arabinose transferase-like glycosyltransferase
VYSIRKAALESAGFAAIAKYTEGTLDLSRKRPAFWCCAIFLVGLLVRLGLGLPKHPGPVSGREVVNVALSLLSTGRFADAYGPGEGPTAHCAPVYPILLSFLYRIFGTGSAGSIATIVLTSAFSSATFALLPLLASIGGLGLTTGVLAGFAGALLPINFWTQTTSTFEAPATAFFLVVLCILACRIQASARFTLREGLIFGLAAGLGCLVSPALVPLLAGWVLLLAVQYRSELRRVLPFSAVVAIAIIATLLPWAIRNDRALGSLIWTRSDFGLELQVSNNDLMTADGERNFRNPAFEVIHPAGGGAEFSRAQRLGEVAYNRSKQQEAVAWIASHKQRFAVLTIERAILFWFPGMQRQVQTVCEAAISSLGFCGLVLAFRRRLLIFWICLPAFTLFPAIYYIVEASPRYRFPIEPVMFLFAAAMLDVVRPRRAKGPANEARIHAAT